MSERIFIVAQYTYSGGSGDIPTFGNPFTRSLKKFKTQEEVEKYLRSVKDLRSVIVWSAEELDIEVTLSKKQ